MKVTKGTRLRRRGSGTLREVVGFTTKPDGERRARLAPVSGEGKETRVKVDGITKNYAIA